MPEEQLTAEETAEESVLDDEVLTMDEDTEEIPEVSETPEDPETTEE